MGVAGVRWLGPPHPVLRCARLEQMITRKYILPKRRDEDTRVETVSRSENDLFLIAYKFLKIEP